MAQTLEGMKGKGGSIKLGTIGTISSLMTRELDQISSKPQKQKVSSRTKPRTLHVSVPCSSSSNTGTSANPKRLQPRKSSDEASGSGSGSSKNTNYRTKANSSSTSRNTHRIPMLDSADHFSVDRTPIRQKKNDKKKPNIVEVVDIKCGNAEKTWATPLATRLKKLGFSKLSESII
ncbi:uncharacterized protein LOC131615829 [Vicia villosa]|uniref:uncharacterized protein LOC131615829 n=1 Tax=Vicia villosa TaxID=3911 RepID=UPI00273CE457|nr:uncharacterized protein LOC131615829 [Vicia villosa]